MSCWYEGDHSQRNVQSTQLFYIKNTTFMLLHPLPKNILPCTKPQINFFFKCPFSKQSALDFQNSIESRQSHQMVSSQKINNFYLSQLFALFHNFLQKIFSKWGVFFSAVNISEETNPPRLEVESFVPSPDYLGQCSYRTQWV